MSNRVNLLAPEVRASPYPVYAELRRNAPVSQVDPGGVWAVTRFADVVNVMKNPQLFARGAGPPRPAARGAHGLRVLWLPPVGAQRAPTPCRERT